MLYERQGADNTMNMKRACQHVAIDSQLPRREHMAATPLHPGSRAPSPARHVAMLLAAVGALRARGACAAQGGRSASEHTIPERRIEHALAFGDEANRNQLYRARWIVRGWAAASRACMVGNPRCAFRSTCTLLARAAER